LGGVFRVDAHDNNPESEGAQSRSAGMPANPRKTSRPRGDETDLIGNLVRFLSGPKPRVLMVRGPLGSGKSTLLRTLVEHLPGPFLFVAYRLAVESSDSPGPESDGAEVSLFLVDRDRATGTEKSDPHDRGTMPLSFAPAGAGAQDPLPTLLQTAIGRLVEGGGGCVVVDSLDRSTEPAFHAATSGREGPPPMRATMGSLRELLRQLPIHAVVALAAGPNPGVEPIADGIVELDSEPIDGTRLRVLNIVKLRDSVLPGTHFLYSLAGGRFYTPPAHRPEYDGPGASVEPDPADEVGTTWPGSSVYAKAFGRLRSHALTALELDPETPHQVADILIAPIVCSVVRSGGRVVWIPAGLSSPAHIGALLSECLPVQSLAQNVRVLSASAQDPALGELAPMVLPARGDGVRGSRGPRMKDPDPGSPLFPEAYRFLREQRTDGPRLFVLSLDGLRALSAVTGAVYHADTVSLIVSTYARLGRFHGIGFGVGDSPLMKAMLPAVDVHLRIHERYGWSVLVGMRPRTPPYLLDWGEPGGRYSLVPVG
jgi:hypothetical protein